MFDGYIICGTPRTGSTLLCGLLRAAGLGDPHSFYRREDVSEWAAEWGLAAPSAPDDADGQRAYLGAVLRAGKGNSSIFGLRLMRENLDELLSILATLYPGLRDDKARLERGFGRLLFLHLSREDKLAQAISYVKARQTGLWHVAPDGTEIERAAPHSEPRYDFAVIRAEVLRLEAFDADWNGWFAAQGIAPLRLGYETLSADPAATLARIGAAVGRPLPDAAAIEPGVAKLADEVSLDWMRRYRQDLEAI